MSVICSAPARDTRRALADPSSEQARDRWDLAVFGQPGRLDFTRITQPWLRESVKQWAVHDLPRRRGRNGANRVRQIVAAAVRLSESLRTRADHGNQPGELRRPDIENFLARLSYLQSQGLISADQRYQTCRHARTVSGPRQCALGLDGPGSPPPGCPAASPSPAPRSPPCPSQASPAGTRLPRSWPRSAPGWTPRSPGTSRPPWRSHRHRPPPDEVALLPLDCLARDADGSPVLIYGNIKDYRKAAACRSASTPRR